MCRRNHLLGCCLGMFGLGMLIGYCFESGVLSVCLGVGLIFLGISLLNRK